MLTSLHLTVLNTKAEFTVVFGSPCAPTFGDLPARGVIVQSLYDDTWIASSGKSEKSVEDTA